MSDLAKLAQQIASYGTKYLFGIPGGGRSLELIDALEKYNVDFILTSFEGSAAMMAATFGHLSKKAGISLSIKGPGLTNMVPGIALSNFESYPYVGISEAYHPDTPYSKAHKRLDHSNLVSSLVKGSRFYHQDSESFHELADWATQEIPGPVLLNLANGGKIKQCTIPSFCEMKRELSGLDQINKSERPIVIAGSLAVREEWGLLLSDLKIPVFTTVAAKGLIDENLSHAAGIYTGVGQELTPEAMILYDSDCIVCLGLRANEVLNVSPFHTQSISIDAVETYGTNGFKFDFVNSTDSIYEIISQLNDKEWGIDSLIELKKRLTDHLSEEFLPGYVYMMIQKLFQSKVRLVMDTGFFCTIGEHAWRSNYSDHCLLSAQGRYMGTGIPMGIASSLFDNTIPTVVVVGDGGISPFISEIRIAVREKLPLILILMTDSGFGSIKSRAHHDGLTVKPLSWNPYSWIPVLEGFGISSFSINKEEDLIDIFNNWTLESGPIFIEIPFEPESYMNMVKGIR